MKFWGGGSDQPEPCSYNGGRLHRCWRSHKASPFFSSVDVDGDFNADFDADVEVDVDVVVDGDVDADLDVDVDIEDLTRRVHHSCNMLY